MTCFLLHYHRRNIMKHFSSARHGPKHFPGFSNFVLLAILFYFCFPDQGNKWHQVKQSVQSRTINDKITSQCNGVLSNQDVPGPVLNTGHRYIHSMLTTTLGLDSYFIDQETGSRRSKYIPISSDWPVVMVHICRISTLEADTRGPFI